MRAGRTIVITDHGRPVARLIPEEVSVRERVSALAQAGSVAWSGRRLRIGNPDGEHPGRQDRRRPRRREPRVIAYLDAGALVKRYVNESGSRETITLIDGSEMVATSIASRAEVAAALAKALRLGMISDAAGRDAGQRFAGDWPDFMRVPVTEALVERADRLAWEHVLRGYDAIQLASALTWQEAAGEATVIATYDQQLLDAASRAGLTVWPERLPSAARAFSRSV